MRVKAAVLRSLAAPPPYADSRPIAIEEIELDPPGEGEVLVKVGGAGLCHSDLSVINASRPRPLPLVLGHEGAGEVVEVGVGVSPLSRNIPTTRTAVWILWDLQQLSHLACVPIIRYKRGF